MPLTKTEHELLDAVVTFGGYVTRGMVELHRPEITVQWANKLLYSLSEKKYIKYAAGDSRLNQQTVYQVTYLACKEFGCPNSHMRRRHNPEAMRRYLIRSHFLFSAATLEQYRPMAASEQRIGHLLSLGFPENVLPYKVNNGTPVTQVEEPILTYRPFAPDGGLCVALVDQPDADPLRQLRTYVGRYIPIIRSQVVPLVFLSVVEGEERGMLYRSLYAALCREVKVQMPEWKTYAINYTYNYCFSGF